MLENPDSRDCFGIRKEDCNWSKKVPQRDNKWYFELVDKNDTIASKTKVNYKDSMKRLLRIAEISETDTFGIHNLIVEPQKYIDKIEKDDSDAYIKVLDTLIGGFYSTLKRADYAEKEPMLVAFWKGMCKKYSDKAREINKRNEPTQRQRRAHVHWLEILKVRDAQEYGSLKHLVLSFYTYLLPRRQLDYANLKVYADTTYEPPRDHNFIHLYSDKHKSPYICIVEYKTARYYGPHIDYDIPRQLIRIICESMLRKPREYLFLDTRGNPFNNANTFQKFTNSILKDIFDNEEVTVTMLRHSLDTFLNTEYKCSVREREIIAQKMGHSLTKSLEYGYIL